MRYVKQRRIEIEEKKNGRERERADSWGKGGREVAMNLERKEKEG